MSHQPSRGKPIPDLLADVRAFHEKFGHSYAGPPRALPTELANFRHNFHDEEVAEARLAYESRVYRDHLDGLVDAVWVLLGTADLAGYDFYEAWRRVFSKNMNEKCCVKDHPDGMAASVRGSPYDVVKLPWFTPPDHSDLVPPDGTPPDAGPATAGVP